MAVDASGLDWDAGNLTKCQSHGVSIREIEEVFVGQPLFSPDEVHSIDEQRFIAVGRSQQGRPIYVVFTFRERDGQRFVRPISARYMHAKEARRYGTKEGTGDED
jgi:uncharacterized DUF497 family protein